MNDKRVEALIYRVWHGDEIDYSRAPPLEFRGAGFLGKVADSKVRFEMTEDFAEERLAREAVETFIREWEFATSIQDGPDYLNLEFLQSEIVDRKSNAGAQNLRVRASAGRPTATMRLTVWPGSYPSPPEEVLDVDHPDVQTLYDRYRGYCQGKEPLASFANFCLTVLEFSVGQTSSRRATAAKQYGIAKGILNRIGVLCSKKGGNLARKREGIDDPFSAGETEFLQRAVKRLIYRVAEYHGNMHRVLPQITSQELNADDASGSQ